MRITLIVAHDCFIRSKNQTFEKRYYNVNVIRIWPEFRFSFFLGGRGGEGGVVLVQVQ